MFKKIMSIVVIFAMGVSLLLIPVGVDGVTGITYYVDAVYGSDSYNGLAGSYSGGSGPWKTFTNVNSKTFQPGDKLLLKRGCVWNEWLQMHGKGTSSALIEVGAYGTGARPIIQRNSNKTEDTLYWYDAAWAKISSITVMDAGQGIRLTGPEQQAIFSLQEPTEFPNNLQYELGTKFKASVDGRIIKVKLYTNASEGGDHSVRIWRVADNTCVAGPYTWTITSGTTGWKAYALPTALNITANTDYIVSISNSTDKYYSKTVNGFSSPINYGDLMTYTGSGVYTQTLGTMPTLTDSNSNYFRDVVFVKGTQGDLSIDDCIAINIKGRYADPGYSAHEGWSEGIACKFAGSLSGYSSSITNCEVIAGGGGILLDDTGTIERCYIHEAVCPTSGFVGIATVGGAFTIDKCILDNSTYYAAWGTSAIMHQKNNTSAISTFKNSILRNTPHTSCYDECGVDFESDCKNVVIDNVVFENNAGPAFEFLQSPANPVADGVEIKNCKFIENCWANPSGRAYEISLDSPATNINIHDNEYKLYGSNVFAGGYLSGVTLTNNVANSSISYNHEPAVNAGSDKDISGNSVVLSDASASDDGTVTIKWEQLSGPGLVTFDDPTAINTAAHFSEPGSYVLRLVADDGTFWKSDYVNVASGVNLALNKTATASTYLPAALPSYAVDGSTASTWCASSGSMPQWWKVDLGQLANINSIKTTFYADELWKYKIEGSTDDSNWTTLVDKTSSGVYEKVMSDVCSGYYRYLRISVTGSGGDYACIREFAVYGGFNLAYNKTATASTYFLAAPPSSAVDGSTTSTWCASSDSMPQWWKVDLEELADINSIKTVFYANELWKYKIEGSTDESNWTTLVDKTSSGVVAQVMNDSVSGSYRYLRITVTGSGGDYACIREFEAYGRFNLALNKTATASTYFPAAPPSSAVDGSTISTWCASSGSMPQWWKVDLGQLANIDSIKTVFYANELWKYKIEGSRDDSNWETLVDKTSSGVVAQVMDDSVSGSYRYLRITVTGSGGDYACIREFEAYGRFNLAYNKTATASTYLPAAPPSSAVDGSPTSTWCATSGSMPQWWKVDLGQLAYIDSIKTVFYANELWKYKIEGSIDDSNWETLVDKTSSGVVAQVMNDRVSGSYRYLRITVTGSGGDYACIREFVVYGS